MWARITELVVAFWLAISLFIFHDSSYWSQSMISAILVALFALLSFWKPLSKMHLCTLGVAIWLCILSFNTFPALASPTLENFMAVGVLLLMLPIVPCHAHLPSPSWQEFYQENQIDKP